MENSYINTNYLVNVAITKKIENYLVSIVII